MTCGTVKRRITNNDNEKEKEPMSEADEKDEGKFETKSEVKVEKDPVKSQTSTCPASTSLEDSSSLL